MLRNKRLLSAQGGNKRFKSDSEKLIPANPFPVNAAPGMQPPENAPLVFPLGSLPPVVPEGLNPMDSEELDESLTESELKEISALKTLLEKLHEDAAAAMQNPNIYRRILVQKWNESRYDPGNKTLAYILHVEQGWTAEGMKDIIGNSPAPVHVPPLCDVESRVLWASLRYQIKMIDLKASLKFEVDLDPKFLVAPLKYHTFTKKGGKEFATRLAAVVAFYQSHFIGGEAGFHEACASVGWKVSKTFAERFLISIFVVAANPELIESSTSNINGTWGTKRTEVKSAFEEAVKTAEENNSVKYPLTLKLFKALFPRTLK